MLLKEENEKIRKNLKIEKEKLINMENLTTQKISELKITILNLQKEKSNLESDKENLTNLLKNETKNHSKELVEKNSLFLSEVKDKEDFIKNLNSKSEAKNAIYSQKIEFLEFQVKELKNQLVETKKSHEVMLNAYEENIINLKKNSVINMQLREIKEAHNKEIEFIEKDFAKTKKKLIEQLEDLTAKYNTFELKHRMDVDEYEKEIEDLNETLSIKEEDKKKLQEVLIFVF